jgi:uncharacterized membrane protein
MAKTITKKVVKRKKKLQTNGWTNLINAEPQPVKSLVDTNAAEDIKAFKYAGILLLIGSLLAVVFANV